MSMIETKNNITILVKVASFWGDFSYTIYHFFSITLTKNAYVTSKKHTIQRMKDQTTTYFLGKSERNQNQFYIFNSIIY